MFARAAAKSTKVFVVHVVLDLSEDKAMATTEEMLVRILKNQAAMITVLNMLLGASEIHSRHITDRMELIELLHKYFDDTARMVNIPVEP